MARNDQCTHVWIDMCCIPEKTSAEYNETVNSMFNIYMQADVCYVYMDDVPRASEDHSAPKSHFSQSEWFKRVQTLQDLIAPRKVNFYANGWKFIGTKASLVETLIEITKIPKYVLLPSHGRSIRDVLKDESISKKMSWAAERLLTEKEVSAYSIMGIFNVSMSVKDKEDEEEAFRRLQIEIIKISNDQTIFAWQARRNSASGILAASPQNFKGGEQFFPIKSDDYRKLFAIPPGADLTSSLTDHGLSIALPLRRHRDIQIGYIAVQQVGWPNKVVAIFLSPQKDREKGHYHRITYQNMPYITGSVPQPDLSASRIFVGTGRPSHKSGKYQHSPGIYPGPYPFLNSTSSTSYYSSQS